MILSIMINFCLVIIDVDECVEDTDGCSQTCTNNNGSFLCSCGTGYTLADDDLGCDGNLSKTIASTFSVDIIIIFRCG